MNTTYNENILYIPDYVLPGDESAIIKFFHNFEIAKVEKVEIYKHKEPEYNTYNNNTYQFYSYAIIYILEWYDTNNAENFYNNIFENKAKIVYNDPIIGMLNFVIHAFIVHPIIAFFLNVYTKILMT